MKCLWCIRYWVPNGEPRHIQAVFTNKKTARNYAKLLFASRIKLGWEVEIIPFYPNKLGVYDIEPIIDRRSSLEREMYY